MRRSDRELSNESTYEILRTTNHGVVSSITPDGLPYGVPVNYVFDGKDIYFHCAHEGLKNDCFNHSKAVSFCVIENATVLPNQFSTAYTSVIVSGTITQITENEIKEEKLILLCKSVGIENEAKIKKYMEPYLEKTCVYKINITSATGKGRS
ncbi:MAG: pyridoxamine 5-phosphate oxidase-related FMN-binding [Bacillales bacterium]|jgi:nitroimidazol reductase NimA-like FMN-containing flavoprotein (pyridoxamine 5'-phosphate oxidase superfamily)|nr:pyridoxamine 5-phosphate oxidase-related FMN-binding [Bacillales bacterium]